MDRMRNFNPIEARNQAATLLDALTGTTDSVIQFRAFSDVESKGLGIKHAPLSTAFDWLHSVQASGDNGVFFQVNGSTTGSDKDVGVDQFRAVFVDVDGGATLDTLALRFGNCPPSAIVKRDDTHLHLYWFLEAGVDANTWQYLQYAAMEIFSGDEKIKNPSRVLRVPGFLHCKDKGDGSERYMSYDLIKCDAGHQRYSATALMQGFVLLPMVSAKVLAKMDTRAKVLKYNTEFEASENDKARAISYLSNPNNASIEGQGGNHALFKACAQCLDLGMSYEQAMDLLHTYFNPNCEPPWEEHDMATTLENAVNHKQNSNGSKTEAAKIERLQGLLNVAGPATSLPGMSVVRPADVAAVAGFETVNVNAPTIGAEGIVTAERISNNDIRLRLIGKDRLIAAQSFLQISENEGKPMVYSKDAGMLRYSNGVYFPVNQKSLSSLITGMSVETVEKWNAGVQESPLTTARSNEVALLVEDLLTNELREAFGDDINLSPAIPFWKGRPDVDARNFIVVNNGVVDMRDGSLIDHTPDLVTASRIAITYDATATCKVWDKLVANLTPEHENMLALQESCGQPLKPSARNNAMLVLGGQGGTGKSLMMSTLAKVYPKVSTPSVGTIIKDNALVSLRGTSVMMMADVTVEPSQSTMFTARMKNFTGGDSLGLDSKGGDVTNVTFACPVFITCNSFPLMREASNAFERRLVYIHTDNVLDQEKNSLTDNNEDLEVALERELAGIFNWCIAGWRRWETQYHKVTKTVGKSRDMMVSSMESASIIGTFLNSTSVEFGADKEVSLRTLFARYKFFMQHELKDERSACSFTTFSNAMRLHKTLSVERRNGGEVVVGICPAGGDITPLMAMPTL